jgi:shikimate dehydrogenase
MPPDMPGNFSLSSGRRVAYNRGVSEPFSAPIGGSTRFCAVYGWPVRHSASPAMQNAGIATLGLDWRYLAFEVHPDQLKAAIEGARAMHFIGLNLTVPHKLLAIGMVEELDASARQWGTVNTIRFEARNSAGEWRPLAEFVEPPETLRAHGFNTDADAIVRALNEDLGFQAPGATVLILGAGGAGRTAILKLAAEGVSALFLVNRTASKAEAIAAEAREKFPGIEIRTGYPAGNVDLVLNATSAGLKPGDPLPFSEREFELKSAAAVYDMIYRPAATPLLKAAQKAGCRVANGLGMLLYQGAKALEIWTGISAPIGVMRAALEANVYGKRISEAREPSL